MAARQKKGGGGCSSCVETGGYTEWKEGSTFPLPTETKVWVWGPGGVMPCEVRRAALALGCTVFGCVMTVSEPPKVNDVQKREPR